MTDRELIELAAKAEGRTIAWDARGAYTVVDGISGGDVWNPLESDADAFRLAVKLTLEVDIHHTGIAVRTPRGHKVLISADEVKCGYAATRRAITRAAAEIGKAMDGGEHV